MGLKKLNEDELIQNWSLNDADKQFLSKFNLHYRPWVYLQLCSLRLFGQLIDNPNTLDNAIIGYAYKALNLPIALTILLPDREATKTEQKKLLFQHLSFKKYDASLDQFHDWIRAQIKKGSITYEQIKPDAEAFLIKNQIALPTPYQLKRDILSFCHRSQEVLYDKLYVTLPKTWMAFLDKLLVTPDDGAVTLFQQLKEYPGSATITLLQNYLERYNKIQELDWNAVKMPEMSVEFSKYLYQLGRYYDAWKIKRFKAKKRYSILFVFITESMKNMTDYLVQMHDQYITNICRECKHIHEHRLKQYKRRNEKAIDTIESFVDYTLDLPEEQSVNMKDVYSNTVTKEDLKLARDDMRQYKLESKYGYSNLLQNRYSSMRRYFSEFIHLPFKSETGSKDLMNAIQLIRDLDSKKVSSIPDNFVVHFIDRPLRGAIYNQNGGINRNILELGIAIAIKDALRSGDLFIQSSNKHVSFWNLVYEEETWKKESKSAYIELGFDSIPNQFTKKLTQDFYCTVSTANASFPNDDFADIRDSKLVLRKKDKLETPDDVEQLQALINSYLPKIKIEQLLMEVDKETQFTKHFTPIHGQKRHTPHFYKSLVSSVMAQAMNIGFATMQDCTPGITAEMMRHANDSCIREETIKASNAKLVNKHSQLLLSKVHGDGSLSSSDGQRFIINASSLLASFYPRYCGYYDKIIGVYTHTSDQYAVYNTAAISCSPRESLYVIDGLLNNNTILSIKEHTTDTEGFTEHIFALCFLLGIKFMPRIKDLKSQQLYRADKQTHHGVFEPLLTKTVSLSQIEEQLDQMIRIVYSMKKRLCPAHEIIRRLSKGAPSDQISKAFTNLGRLIKTDYILQYITDSELRNKVYRQLNKGEHRHGLARWIFFANQGKFQVGDYEEIMNKASCLSLVSNAALYWNTVKMSEIVQQLRDNGEDISDTTLSHISLLPFKHITPMGTYFAEPTPFV